MPEFLTRYYGVDWAVFLLVLTHMWMLGQRMKSAFVVGGIATLFGFAFGLLIESVATLVMNACFCIMHIRCYTSWCRYEAEYGKVKEE